MSINAREAILLAARNIAQSQGYNGLNYRDLASAVGIKPASIYYHFPSKADLGIAVARRYWEDGAAALEVICEQTPNPLQALQRFPEIFRRSLEADNRLCLGSFVGPRPIIFPCHGRGDSGVCPGQHRLAEPSAGRCTGVQRGRQ